MSDEVSERLVRSLVVALEVPGVPGANIRPLEVPDKDPLKIRIVVDAIVWEEFEPWSNMFPHVDGEVLNDEVVIIHSSVLAGKPEVFEPYIGVRLPGILGDVGRRSEALWERRSPNTPAKGPWSRAIRAGTPVVWPATMPGAHFTAPLDGPSRARVACPRCRPKDVIIIPGLMPVADDAASIFVRTEPFAY